MSRIPPHNVKIERGVLGYLLLNVEDREHVTELLDVLRDGSCFYRESHQRLYRSFKERFENGYPCDNCTIGQIALNGDLLVPIDLVIDCCQTPPLWYPYRNPLADECHPPVSEYVDRVVALSDQRTAIAALNEALNRAWDGDYDMMNARVLDTSAEVA
ncbi:MAG: hypothetical protein LBK67_10025 [Coriobacteriales bacterium]|jgi:replicative DNA helicase|nr:hypothetical protein [Coriobacteriales bacterium]